jgi:Amt family ammonium transporter
MEINSGDTAWLLVSAALVLLMTPGLGLFYGGLVRAKNAAATIMQCFIMLGVVGVVWVLWGYSLAFGPDLGGFIGNLEWFGLRHVTGEPGPYSGAVPHLAFMAFQMMFAVITPALIIGAFAERAKFSTFLIFMVLWVTVVYAPLAHWVWSLEGWLGLGGEVKALDFAGGTVVHINAGAGALAAALIYGKRRGIERETVPHDVTMVLVGAALLWFGWFGFNAGSALTAGGGAANAFVTTNTATAMGALTWMGLSWYHTRRPSIVGAATGAVAGLVAITPAAGFIGEWPATDGYGNALPALIIGAMASILGFYAVRLRHRFGFDDTLDVVAVHGVGGLTGAFLTGVFAVTTIAGVEGLIQGSADQLWRQLAAMGVAVAWSFVLTSVILLGLRYTMGLRVREEEELTGLDRAQHEEPAYAFDEPGLGSYSGGISTVVAGPAPRVGGSNPAITESGEGAEAR